MTHIRSLALRATHLSRAAATLLAAQSAERKLGVKSDHRAEVEPNLHRARTTATSCRRVHVRGALLSAVLFEIEFRQTRVALTSGGLVVSYEGS